jgi:peptidoglycan glycosyltransferase
VNVPLRRVAIFSLLLFVALIINANYVQVIDAHSLSTNPHNSRLIISEYSFQRGDILVDGQAVAQSVPTKSGGLAYQRTYPGKGLFAPVTGFYSLVYGASELESAYNEVLAGTDPRLTLDRLQTLFGGKHTQGGSVVTTLSKAAQTAAVKALDGREGAIAALDPKTGAILALVTSPSYEPGAISSDNTESDIRHWTALVKESRQPMLDRATQASYPPGSTFKIVTTAAALSSGRYTPQTQVADPPELALPLTSHLLHNFESESCSPDPTQSLAEALRVSCDTAFAKIGLELGPAAVRAEAEKFGFLSTIPGFPLSQNPSTFLPVPSDAPAFAALDAVGQGDVSATPLHMAMIAATIANGGVEMTPYVVARTLAPNLSALSTTTPNVFAQPVTPKVATEIKTMMVSVVASGTGTAAAIPGVAVAGKTGTAQTSVANRLDDWFIAFAPANDPTIAVAVVVADQPGVGQSNQGGLVAAPVAKQVIEAYLDAAKRGHS